MIECSLPPGCHLRPASAEDRWTIRKLVLMAKLDPTQLRWSQFWIIECQQQLVACGQLRTFSEAQELGSLVVTPAWRGQGLGTLLTQHLIQQASKPLYLECMARLIPFYSRFGFQISAWQDLPRSLKLKFGISKLAATVLPIPVRFMEYPQQQLNL